MMITNQKRWNNIYSINKLIKEYPNHKNNKNKGFSVWG